MKTYKPSHIRNVALLGHAGSGKSTLAETMLFEAGEINRRGSAGQSNLVSDYHEIEKEKQKSIFSTLLALDWRGYKINLIDTPGTADYFGEVAGTMKVAATSIFVISADQGVEVGTEMLWDYTNRYKTPAIIVVNKVDHDKSDFQKCVDQAKERFGRGVVVVQYPYNEGESFNAIIDVLKMTMYEFPEDGGKPDKLPIPEAHRAQAELLHNELVETIAENDEMLLDLYFEKGELEEDEMREGFRKAMVNHEIFPLFCLSAERNMGSGRLMGFIDNIAPSPLDAAGTLDINGNEIKVDPDGDPLAFVFKAHSEQHVGDLLFVKCYGGTIKSGLDLINSRTGNSERIGSLYTTQGKKRLELQEVNAGDIAAIVKLKDTGVSDTLRIKEKNVTIDAIHFPEPTIRTAVKVLKSGEEEKLGMALHQLHREDPSLQVDHNAELKQTIISGQGEEHLSVVSSALKNRFKVEVEYIAPKIPYRETITKSVKSQYKHKKQSGGAGQYGEVYLIIEPYIENMPDPEGVNVRARQLIDLEWGGKLEFLNCIVGGVIDNRFIPAALKGVMDKMMEGPMTGSRVRDVRVALYDGSMHSVDSNEAAFKTAAMMAFKKGFLEASPQLLEPIYEIEVLVPNEYMGDVLSDLSTRRGQISGMGAEGIFQKIKANVPLSELYKYSTHLKSMTQGRAMHKRSFKEYAHVPRDVQERVVKEYQSEDE